MEFSSLQFYLYLPFFCFTVIFLVFSAVVLLLSSLQRSRPCCEVCEAYANSTWMEEFDNIIDWHTHLLRQSPTSTVHIHILGMIITANPDNVEYMLKTNFENFPKGKQFSAILRDLLGEGIFNVDGDPWRFQRKMASLELTASTVRSNAFSVVTGELRHRLLPFLDASTATVDLQDVFRRFTFDTICKISFGIDPKCLDLSLPISEFAAAFDTATQLSAGRALASSQMMWKINRFFNRGPERELRRAIKLVDNLAGEVIRQRRRQPFSDANNLLSRFMSSVDNDKLVRDIVVSFLLAGRDTVAAGLTAFFHLISTHPAAEAAILDEISRGPHGEVSFDELRGMQYVHAALYECMRLYPPVQFDSKFCLDDDVLVDGTFVSRGTRVTYHPYAMGRMEKIWGADCEDFRPERWLREGVFSPESPFRYPVFQGGVRVCLGKEMAVMEMMAVVVSVLREFEVRVEWRSPKFAPGLTSSLAGGLPAVVSRRRQREVLCNY